MGLISPVNMIQLSPGRKPPYGTPLNRSHPLAHELHLSLPLNEAGGNRFYSSVGDAYGTVIYDGTSGNVWQGGDFRPIYVSSIVGVCGNIPKEFVTIPYADFTYTIRFCVHSWPASVFPTIFQLGTQANGGNLRLTYTTAGDNTSLKAYLKRSDAASAYNVALPTASVAGKYYTVSIVVNRAGTVDAYLDGVYIGSTTSISAYAAEDYTPDCGLVLGAYHNNINEADTRHYLDGRISHCYVHRRAVTPQEVQSLYIDPSAMFRPSIPYWFVSSGTAEVTGTVEGELDRLTGSLTIKHGVAGSVAGETDKLSGAIAAVHGVTGTLSGSLQRISTSIDGVSGYSGTITGSLLRLGGALSGGAYELVSGTIDGELDELTGQFTGTVSIQAAINGELDRLEGSISGRFGNAGRSRLVIELEIGI